MNVDPFCCPNISEIVRATTNQLKASTQKCFWYNSMKQNVYQSPLLSIKSPFLKTFTVKIQRYLMMFLNNKHFSTDSCGLFYLANSRATLFTLRCQLITKYLKDNNALLQQMNIFSVLRFIQKFNWLALFTQMLAHIRLSYNQFLPSIV